MAWTVPRTWVVGETVTAAFMNTHVRDNTREIWREVDYVEVTSDVSITGIGSGNQADVVAGTSQTYAATPIIIMFYCAYIERTSSTVYWVLWDGATQLGGLGRVSATTDAVATSMRKLTPTAATHQYKVRAYVDGGTGTFNAGAGTAGVDMPLFIRVTQKGV